MDKVNTSYRLKSIMNERNLRQIDILNLTKPYCDKYNIKMNKSDISQYVSGKNEPSQDKLVILGMALGVNEAWLMGYNVPKERSATITDGDNNELDAFRSVFKSLGWSCELLICDVWKHHYKWGGDETPPIGCMYRDGIQRNCENCYMKGPKYVFTNGNTSFEISTTDYQEFINVCKDLLLKQIQKLMLKSASEIFDNDYMANAAHARTDIDTPEGTDTSDDDIMDDENF